MDPRLFNDSNSSNQIKEGIAYLQSRKLATSKNCAVVESSPEYGLKLVYANSDSNVNNMFC